MLGSGQTKTKWEMSSEKFTPLEALLMPTSGLWSGVEVRVGVGAESLSRHSSTCPKPSFVGTLSVWTCHNSWPHLNPNRPANLSGAISKATIVTVHPSRSPNPHHLATPHAPCRRCLDVRNENGRRGDNPAAVGSK